MFGAREDKENAEKVKTNNRTNKIKLDGRKISGVDDLSGNSSKSTLHLLQSPFLSYCNLHHNYASRTTVRQDRPSFSTNTTPF